MRRALLCAAMAMTVLSFPASPAEAADGTCAGMGVMVTSAPITNVGFGPSKSVSWTVSFTVGACVGIPLDMPPFTATGVLTGWCDLSTGTGVTNQGNRFAWIGIGARHFYTGGFTGEVPFVPNTVNGESCYSGADNFLVGWAGGLLWDCKVTSSSGTLTTLAELPLHYNVCA